jgi:hypothetical protein
VDVNISTVPRTISGTFPLSKKNITDRVSGSLTAVAYLHIPSLSPEKRDIPHEFMSRNSIVNSDAVSSTPHYGDSVTAQTSISHLKNKLQSKKLSDKSIIKSPSMTEDCSFNGKYDYLGSSNASRGGTESINTIHMRSRSEMMLNLTRSMDALATTVQEDADFAVKQFSKRLHDKVESECTKNI